MADPKLPEVLQANLDTNATVSQNQQKLQNAMAVFAASNKTFSKTSVALNDFAKQQITKLNPFKSLKDKFDNSFAGQKLRQKKEEENLAKAAGITRDELLLLKANKELKEAQTAQADALKNSLDEYGLNVNTFFNDAGELQTRMAERDETGRFQSAQTIVNGIVGSMESGQMQEIENRREQARRDEEQSVLLGSLAGGISKLGDNLLKGLKSLGKGGGMGLGIFAGLVATPLIVLSNFFGQLKKEFRALKNLTNTKILAPIKSLGTWLKGLGGQFKTLTSTKYFTPFKNFGNWLKGLGGQFKGLVSSKLGKSLDPIKNLGTSLKAAGNQLKASTAKNIIDPLKSLGSSLKNAGSQFKAASKANVINPATNAITGIRSYFSGLGANVKTAFSQGGKFGIVSDIGKSIKGMFGSGGKFASISKAFKAGFQPISKFAAGAGKLLGKLFLPVTVIMGIIDAVKGFMEGFSEEGIVGGLAGAFEGVITGLVAVPLDLLKNLVSWIAGKLGFEGLSEKLDSFSFAEMFAKFFDFIQNIRLAIGDWIQDKLLSLKSLRPEWLGGLSDEEIAQERANLDAERAARDDLIAENRLKKTAKNKGISVDELKMNMLADETNNRQAADLVREKLSGNPAGAGGNKGAEVNAQSAQAASAAGNVVVTTIAPTNVNAPTSTSVSNQTNVTPTASRNRNRSRRGRQYAPA